MPAPRTFDLVIAANRLPVDRFVAPDGSSEWHRSPGGLVTAMDSVMRGWDGAWVGWHGEPGEAPEPFEESGMWLHPVPLSEDERETYYEGFSNDTLWPIYHDVIVPAHFHREWWQAYKRVNQRFADAVCEVAAPGATVWIHDYQLQLVPSLVRAQRPDVRIGWFNHIPFPPVELFAQLPWRSRIIEGLLGADYLGFQRTADAHNFLRACRRHDARTTKGEIVETTDPDGSRRRVRASAVPISVVELYTETEEPTSALPVNSGVWTFVTRSESEIPESEVAASTGAGVPVGAVVSMLTSVDAETGPWFAARSVAWAVNACPPAGRELKMMV